MSKKGRFDESKLPENWMKYVSWSWAKIDELDEGAHQESIRKALLNSTTTYRDVLGPDWREKLMQTREEIEWFKANKLPHPSFEMISGGERTGADETADGNSEI